MCIAGATNNINEKMSDDVYAKEVCIWLPVIEREGGWMRLELFYDFVEFEWVDKFRWQTNATKQPINMSI